MPALHKRCDLLVYAGRGENEGGEESDAPGRMRLKVQFLLRAFLPLLAQGACVSLFLSYLCDYSFQQWYTGVNYGTPVRHTTCPGFFFIAH